MSFMKGKPTQQVELPAGKDQSLAVAYAMKRKAKKMADGGFVTSQNQGAALKEDCDGDHIDQIMARMMSKGGMVANDTGDDLAGFKENEFDDLVLRDDLEPTFDGPGNEIGDSQEEDDRRDMVSQIMKSRYLKDKLPRTR